MKHSKQLKKATLFIKGMHCSSCDILVHDQFKKVKNVKEVEADYKNLTAEVIYRGHLDKNELSKTIEPYGYSISEKHVQEYVEPWSQRITEAGVIGLILFIIYYFAQDAKLIPGFNTGGSGLTLVTAFVLGLIASTSTCMATSGALFMSTIGKLQRKGGSMTENIIPAVSFNLGRVLSYGVFGFVIGFLGKEVATTLQLGSWLTLFVSVFMVLIGLHMLKLISFSFLNGTSLTKGLFEKLESHFIKQPKKTAFFLGAITYLLPCGFTQSVQLYALGLANPVQSALMMMVFALGTVPALLAIGFTSSFTKHSFYPLFQKTMGVIILAIGIMYLSNFATIYGVNVNPFAGTSNGPTTQAVTQGDVQEINMTVDAGGYTPNSFTVKQGTKVRWVIDGKNTFGCQSVLKVPKYNIVKTLSSGKNVIEFTPTEKGTISFSCIMGMFRGTFQVI